MVSRMEKYAKSLERENQTKSSVPETNKEVVVTSREKKNQQLYKEVSKAELEDFDVNSNVSVIGKSSSSIDIDKIRDMLDKKYHKQEKDKSIADDTLLDSPKVHLDETREYNLGAALDKAKRTKEVNYEEERLKKIRNTQYDILKDLDIFKSEEEEEAVSEEVASKEVKSPNEKKLVDLINTITAKELLDTDTDAEMNPLDLLSDLYNDDENTRVLGANELSEDAIDVAEHKRVETTYEKEDLEETIETLPSLPEVQVEEDGKEFVPVSNDLHTVRDLRILGEDMQARRKRHKSYEKVKNSSEDIPVEQEDVVVKKLGETSSFDDFSDLKEDSIFIKILVRIIIILIILLFIAGCVFFANKYFDLGLF